MNNMVYRECLCTHGYNDTYVLFVRRSRYREQGVAYWRHKVVLIYAAAYIFVDLYNVNNKNSIVIAGEILQLSPRTKQYRIRTYIGFGTSQLWPGSISFSFCQNVQCRFSGRCTNVDC